MRYLLCLITLLVCSCKKYEPSTSTFENLKNEVQYAVSTNNFELIEQLHYETSEWTPSHRLLMEQILEGLSQNEYTITSTEYLPYTSGQAIEIKPTPQKYISIIA